MTPLIQIAILLIIFLYLSDRSFWRLFAQTIYCLVRTSPSHWLGEYLHGGEMEGSLDF